jgi:hypothetical protein
MKHHEFMLITDFRLHLSPIGDKPQRILDVGTGTGELLCAFVSIDPMKLKTQQVSGLSKLASHVTFTYDAQGALIVLAEFYPSAEVIGTGQ